MQEHVKFFNENFDITKILNIIETELTAEDVDNNGHVSEVGYLKVANWAYWEICERVGLLELYNQYRVSGIVFDTHMTFKKEIFKGEKVMVRLRFSILEDIRKIIRRLDIFNNENEIVVEIISNGGFLDLEKRKIVEPPKEILETCLKYLKD